MDAAKKSAKDDKPALEKVECTIGDTKIQIFTFSSDDAVKTAVTNWGGELKKYGFGPFYWAVGDTWIAGQSGDATSESSPPPAIQDLADELGGSIQKVATKP